MDSTRGSHSPDAGRSSSLHALAQTRRTAREEADSKLMHGERSLSDLAQSRVIQLDHIATFAVNSLPQRCGTLEQIKEALHAMNLVKEDGTPFVLLHSHPRCTCGQQEQWRAHIKALVQARKRLGADSPAYRTWYANDYQQPAFVDPSQRCINCIADANVTSLKGGLQRAQKKHLVKCTGRKKVWSLVTPTERALLDGGGALPDDAASGEVGQVDDEETLSSPEIERFDRSRMAGPSTISPSAHRPLLPSLANTVPYTRSNWAPPSYSPTTSAFHPSLAMSQSQSHSHRSAGPASAAASSGHPGPSWPLARSGSAPARLGTGWPNSPHPYAAVPHHRGSHVEDREAARVRAAMSIDRLLHPF